MVAPCLICGNSHAESSNRGFDNIDIKCPVCGNFTLSQTESGLVGLPLKPGTRQAAVISHAIRKIQKANDWPVIKSSDVERIIKADSLPSVAEQADNLIIWLGEHLSGSGDYKTISFDLHKAILGTMTGEGVAFIIRSLLDQELIESQGQNSNQLRNLATAPATLSFEGWQRYEALKRGASDSRKGFMAMKFGDATLDAVFLDCFTPAVAQTGFELVRLDEKPKAGLIDDRLRVEIRSARFVIADLTHSNLGAYWEAGYAEGLGKPVIYTCENSIFEKGKTHFDTNHHLTVPWEPDNLKDAAQRLKDTIRATLPAEAKLND